MFLLVDRHLSSRQGKWSTHDTKVKQRSHPLVHNSSIDDSASSFSGTEDQEEDKSPKGVKHILRNKMAVLDDVGQGRTVTGGSPTSKKRRKPAGAASDLFNKFDSDRKYDPFEDNDPVIRDSKDGMEALLSMCNAVEINSIFGALGFIAPCPRRAKEQQVTTLTKHLMRSERSPRGMQHVWWDGPIHLRKPALVGSHTPYEYQMCTHSHFTRVVVTKCKKRAGALRYYYRKSTYCQYGSSIPRDAYLLYTGFRERPRTDILDMGGAIMTAGVSDNPPEGGRPCSPFSNRSHAPNLQVKTGTLFRVRMLNRSCS